MDHIIADFELPPNEVPSVPDLTEKEAVFPDNWEKFHSYPRENGWSLDEQTYTLKLLPGTGRKTVDRLKFLQSWLFFGLIMTVVQKEGYPLLEKDKLRVEPRRNDKRITTDKLPEALNKWRDWEQEQYTNRKYFDVRLRMVRIEAVLDAARRTIQANCSHHSSAQAQLRSTDDEHSVPRDKETISLSLMILGETLSLIKAKIMKTTHSELRGWHGEDGSGWGPPAYVLNRMSREEWCMRTIHLWKSQLRSNATLMLASYLAYKSLGRFRGPKHKECTRDDCLVTSKDDEGNYDPAHAHPCDYSPCEMQGPNMNIIREHLRNDEIPLLKFNHAPSPDGSKGQLSLSIVNIPKDNSNPFDYVTISHVWSDGFGNETANELRCCQLRYIRDILNTLGSSDGWATPFWMDTLVVPVGTGKEDTAQRKCAIKQIFRVFKGSAYTIVLDNGLLQMSPGTLEKPAWAAMRILGSSWMRRLWTLQEAFLSQKVYFAFDGEYRRSHLKELQELSQTLGPDGQPEVNTALLDRVNDHLQHLIMSHEHETRNTYLFTEVGSDKDECNMPREKTASLVASAWKAARWRTTSNAFHETLALATLLDLDWGDTDIAKKGLQQVKSTKKQDKNRNEAQNNEKDHLVEEFWTKVIKRWPNGIPPGIIFLPGDRVRRIGFGWAPRTWMTAQPVDHPDPLALMNSTAKMAGPDGLEVRYPGFILHPQDRSHILATDKHKKRFWFPTGPSFLDWYVVESIEDDEPQQFIQKIRESNDRLGIIVSRAKPGDVPSEIGLLVQIREHRSKEMWAARSSPKVTKTHVGSIGSMATCLEQREAVTEYLYCQIVHRVKVSRETRSDFRTSNRARFLNADDGDAIPVRPRSQISEAPNRNTLKRNTPNQIPSNQNTADQDSVVPKVMTDFVGADGKPEVDRRICLAEELGPEQVWYVDGYFPTRDSSAPNGGSDASHSSSKKSSGNIFGTLFGWGRQKQSSGDNAGPPSASLPLVGSAGDEDRNPPQLDDQKAKPKKAYTWFK
ncbi:hypothetical protein G7054_g942 [Neopestalotiopsis clavispora]|nr:hypothetical protein G7054_g942 [Neopestalotiopsis clavispora]